MSKPEILQLTRPVAGRPLLSETFQVVRREHYEKLLAEIERLHKTCVDNRAETGQKAEKYSKNNRFKAAFNWWRGCQSSWDIMAYQLDRLIKDSRGQA